MAIEVAIMDSLALTEQYRGERWLEQFLTSGCMVSSGTGRVWIGWGNVFRSSVRHFNRLSLYAPDFLLTDSCPWMQFEFSEEFSVDELLSLLPVHVESGERITWLQPSKEEFAQVFEDIQGHIQRGELSKAVPAIVRSSHCEIDSNLRLCAIRNALIISQRSPLLAYGFWTSDGEGMIGATPEVLFEQRASGELTTMALAGTRRTDDSGASLLTDSKEMFEHRVVVDGIVERLAGFGEISIGETREVRLPALIHLHTGIRVSSESGFDFSDCVEALHPTPAIGAWPREAGWKWLRSQANAESRIRFGAPFGMMPPGSPCGRCLVAIRNLQWREGEAWLMAGSGIVSASQLDREWAELHSKLDSVQGALGI